MRRITMWFIATVVVVVLLFSYRTSLGGGQAPAQNAGVDTGANGGAANGTGANPPGVVPGPTASGAPAPSAGSTVAGGTAVNGTVVQTRWGPVQVKVTIAGGRITDVVALQVPDGNFRDQQINSYAVPRLREEVLSAQSAQIDTVSGATVTSDGYIGSLQAALDAAHFRS
jgi:uncharacterized protein with FMN-binding domain